MPTRVATLSALLACAFLGCWPAAALSTECPARDPRGPVAVYVSEKGETLTACFDNQNQSVVVVPPGKPAVELLQAVSGSGARFSNGRETFWEHHGDGSYWVGEELVFEGKARE